jgi:SAM-dependent methyltransferase
MSTPSKNVHTGQDIVKFYTERLQSHGNSSQGVGWKNDDAQIIRFVQLAKVVADLEAFTINDLGCGTGQFYKFLLTNKFAPTCYIGYDILQEMIDEANGHITGDKKVIFKKIASSTEMEISDYSVASGIFNVKYESSEADWLHYVLTTIEDMNARSKTGFAFNLLTKYSDREFMQSYLYYADPLFYFDYCKRNFSKNVALLHDYDQYDFTILVRK